MIKVFLAGDLMTGRGIDQVLPRSCDPVLYEPWVDDARRYVELAERRNGPIERPLGYAELWGAALVELELRQPDARIVNLETSITTSDDYWPGKGINYRMHPENVGCLTAACIDCCVLANNHVLDWGYVGLSETIAVLDRAGLAHTGAGGDVAEAQAPAIMDLADRGRIVVYSFGDETSGIPKSWSAGMGKPGVNLLDDTSPSSARRIAAAVSAAYRHTDVVVVSLHWGGNWGYDVEPAQRQFAHELIDSGVVDIVHGHSSHHPKGIEVYRGKPIIFGCGDLLNDYEGIPGYEEFRDDLALMYFIDIDPSGRVLRSVDLVPVRVERFRLVKASADDALWLKAMLDREGRAFGTRARLNDDGSLGLEW